MTKQDTTHDRETPIERAGAPRGAKGPARVDFGYSWFWTYGHLLPAAALTTAAIASAQTGGPGWLTVGSGAIELPPHLEARSVGEVQLRGRTGALRLY